jgi:hypothetical protein
LPIEDIADCRLPIADWKNLEMTVTAEVERLCSTKSLCSTLMTFQSAIGNRQSAMSSIGNQK